MRWWVLLLQQGSRCLQFVTLVVLPIALVVLPIALVVLLIALIVLPIAPAIRLSILFLFCWCLGA
jgi:hypothetical protein